MKQKRSLAWRLLLSLPGRRQYVRRCKGNCDDQSVHDSHLTPAARLALRLP